MDLHRRCAGEPAASRRSRGCAGARTASPTSPGTSSQRIASQAATAPASPGSRRRGGSRVIQGMTLPMLTNDTRVPRRPNSGSGSGCGPGPRRRGSSTRNGRSPRSRRLDPRRPDDVREGVEAGVHPRLGPLAWSWVKAVSSTDAPRRTVCPASAASTPRGCRRRGAERRGRRVRPGGLGAPAPGVRRPARGSRHQEPVDEMDADDDPGEPSRLAAERRMYPERIKRHHRTGTCQSAARSNGESARARYRPSAAGCSAWLGRRGSRPSRGRDRPGSAGDHRPQSSSHAGQRLSGFPAGTDPNRSPARADRSPAYRRLGGAAALGGAAPPSALKLV